jgi:hypothetical protein
MPDSLTRAHLRRPPSGSPCINWKTPLPHHSHTQKQITKLPPSPTQTDFWQPLHDLEDPPVPQTDPTAHTDPPTHKRRNKNTRISPAQTTFWQPLHNLEDCTVLAVSWQDVHTILPGQGQHKGAASNEGLLVCEANVLTSLDGSDCAGFWTAAAAAAARGL